MELSSKLAELESARRELAEAQATIAKAEAEVRGHATFLALALACMHACVSPAAECGGQKAQQGLVRVQDGVCERCCECFTVVLPPA